MIHGIKPDLPVKNNLSAKEDLHFLLQRSRGIPVRTDLGKYNKILMKMNFSDTGKLTDHQLLERVGKLQRTGDIDPVDFFPLVCEACTRHLGLRPFPEQLLCGLALVEGMIAQMNTGEGKTLAATFAASFKALSRKGVHILTANEYLASRDAQWMAPVYEALGLSVDSIQENMSPERRREAYRADITYLTVRKAGFDLLQDSLAWEMEDRVQRPFHYCLVDEADFIMIDEARIPLVIAGEDDYLRPDPLLIKKVLPELRSGVHFTEDRAGRSCTLTIEGQEKVARLLNCGEIHDSTTANWYGAVHVALHAEHQLQRDVDYIVRDNRIELVDEFTGRIADGRKWPDGIQGALEAKEGIPVHREGRVYSSITVHSLIGLYPAKSGMTATAAPAAAEFYKTYGLETLTIPPHLTKRLKEPPDRIFLKSTDKIKAIVSAVSKEHGRGRPVLIGTASVRESEEIGQMLECAGIPNQILNARNDEHEAPVISRAGMLGVVTISTNMAGRGTDIKLGGPEEINREKIIKMGGLYIIGTSRFESRRIDNQLKGRAARQGDPGECQFFLSLEDPLIQRYGILEFFPKSVQREGCKEEIKNKKVSKEIARAQEIIENQHGSIRETLYRYSEITERQRKQIYNLRDEILGFLSTPPETFDALFKRLQELTDLNFSAILIEAGRLEKKLGTADTILLICRLWLQEIDLFWSNHLLTAAEIKEGIHLVRYGSKAPLYVYIDAMVEQFDLTILHLLKKIARRLNTLATIDSTERPERPSSTWVYQINDNPQSFFGIYSAHGLVNSTVAMVIKVLHILFLAPVLLYRRLR